MCATVDRSTMIQKCIQFQLSMFVPMPSLLSLLFESSSLLPRPCLIIIKQRSSETRSASLHVTVERDPFYQKHFCASPLAGSPSTEPLCLLGFRGSRLSSSSSKNRTQSRKAKNTFPVFGDTPAESCFFVACPAPVCSRATVVKWQFRAA